MRPSACGRSDQLDPSGVSGGRCQGGIPSHEGDGEGLGKGDIRGIIGGEIVPELPDSRKEDVMGIAGEREVHQVFERLQAPLPIKIPSRRVPAKHLHDLQVEEVRRVQSLPCREQAVGDPRPYPSVEEDLENGRGIDHDQRRSRSARTAREGGTRGVTGVRRAVRSFNSAAVGRSAIRRASRNR